MTDSLRMRLLSVVARPLADVAVAVSRLERAREPLRVVRAMEKKLDAVEDAIALTGFALDLTLAVAEAAHGRRGHDEDNGAESEIEDEDQDQDHGEDGSR